MIVPLCLWHRPSRGTLSFLSAHLSAVRRSEPAVLEASFPHVVAYYLPHAAAAENRRGEGLLAAAHGGPDSAKRFLQT